jgi:2-dehydro-3-deoxygluconokinase
VNEASYDKPGHRGVLTIGETMVLVTPTTAEPLEHATDFRLDIAGAESNVASHLVRAGVLSAWAGAVGDDPLGRRLVATLDARGVDTSLVHLDPDAPTGVMFKDPGLGGTGVRYYRRDSAASRLGPAFAATLPLRSVAWVHLSGITAALSDSCRALLDEILGVRRSAGLPTSFDVNYRPALWNRADAARDLLALARRCDLVFVGRDEADTLWGTSTAADVRRLLGGDVRLVVKDGGIGAHSFHRGGADFVSARTVPVLEPVGAGDAFAAGYLAAHLAGEPPTSALSRGHLFAAAVLATTADY